MTYRQSLVVAALSAACVVGCNKKADDTTTSVQTPSGSATVTTPSENTAQSTVDNIKGATDAAMQNAKDYTAKATGQADAATATAAAQDKLAQAVQYIKDNKYDLADKSLGELEGMKDKLPDSINKQVETARAQLTALKASNGAMGGLKMPGQ